MPLKRLVVGNNLSKNIGISNLTNKGELQKLLTASSVLSRFLLIQNVLNCMPG